jgi:acylphosphatase
VAAESNPQRVHVVVRGYVQGVKFRYSAQRQARSLGLNGWVRNAPDGSVEAVVEGEPEAMRSFVTWMHSGPSGASVDSVDTDEEPAQGEVGFRILP